MSQNDRDFLYLITIAKLTEEKKICYLAGDFNIDLLKSDTDNHAKDFFDTVLDTQSPSDGHRQTWSWNRCHTMGTEGKENQ